MKNPWINLPKSKPYVLKDDVNHINKFNKKVGDQYLIHTNILPEPFLGDPKKAKLVLLNLNPGYDAADEFWHKNEEFIIENKKCLEHKSRTPFYLLDESFKNSAGYIWWKKHLRELIETVGINKVSENLMCIEYFPYHSRSYNQLKSKELENNLLESQKYSIFLVKEAIKSNKLIIIMRSKKLWFEAVPELIEYDYLSLKSTQSAYISNNNIKDNRFEEIINLISE